MLREISQYFALAPTGSVFILLFGFYLFHLLSNKFRSDARKIPGPALAGWTGLWKFNDIWKGSAEITTINLHKKYGSIVRIGPKHISFDSPEAVSTLYGLKSPFTKTGFYSIFEAVINHEVKPNLFSARDPKIHNALRRQVAHAYSTTSLLDLEDAVDSCSALFVSKLDEFAQSSRSVDLGSWLQYYAFDVIGEISLSKKIGFLESGTDWQGTIATLEGMMLYQSLVGQYPSLHKFLLGNPLLDKFFPSLENFNTIQVFTTGLMDIKQRDKDAGIDLNGPKDMHSKWAPSIDYFNLLNFLMGNIFAGSDTTAIALRAVIYFLCRNPDKKAKLVAEIDNAERAGLISETVKYNEAKDHLPYLDAVLKESMRLHPSVGLPLERHVPAGGATICGKNFSAGTVVGVNPWAIHRNSQVFQDPDSFQPERWLENSEEKLKQMDMCMITFGAGSRTCIGKNISMLEMSKVIPQLFRKFTIELAEPEKEWTTSNRWFVHQRGLVCVLKRRGPLEAK